MDESLTRLIDGNRRFAEGSTAAADAADAKPFAVVLTCADGRVAPEILFDQPIGSLFVVRVAGNIAGPLELASIEMAVGELGASLVIVLGHTGCKAVGGTMDGRTGLLFDDIRAHVGKVSSVEAAIPTNVKATVDAIKQSPILADADVRGAVYAVEDGRVTFLD